VGGEGGEAGWGGEGKFFFLKEECWGFTRLLTLSFVLRWKDFPRFMVNFIKRFVTGSYASASSPSSPPPSSSTSSRFPPPSPSPSPSPITRDAFGFSQILVLATKGYGKVFGVDSGSGEVVWGRVLGFGVDGEGEVEVELVPVGIVVMGGDGDGSGSGEGEGGGEGPKVVLVVQRYRRGEVRFRFPCSTPR
jgi:ER membrane protein complex subunit 1